MLTIVIVEENEPMRRLLVALVSELEARVYECRRITEIYAAFNSNGPDVVVIDLDAAEVGSLLGMRKLHARYPRTRIVMLGESDDQRLYEAVRQAGAAGYVPKENLLALPGLLSNGRS